MKKLILALSLFISLPSLASECSVYVFDAVHIPNKYQKLVNNIFFQTSHPRQQDKDLMDLYTEHKDIMSLKQALKLINALTISKNKQLVIKNYYYTHRRALSTKQIQRLFQGLPENKADYKSSLKLVRLITTDHLRLNPFNKKAERLHNRALSTLHISDLEWRMFVLSNW